MGSGKEETGKSNRKHITVPYRSLSVTVTDHSTTHSGGRRYPNGLQFSSPYQRPSNPHHAAHTLTAELIMDLVSSPGAWSLPPPSLPPHLPQPHPGNASNLLHRHEPQPSFQLSQTQPSTPGPEGITCSRWRMGCGQEAMSLG